MPVASAELNYLAPSGTLERRSLHCRSLSWLLHRRSGHCHGHVVMAILGRDVSCDASVTIPPLKMPPLKMPPLVMPLLVMLPLVMLPRDAVTHII